MRFVVEMHGTIAIIRPKNARSRRWLKSHASAESWQWLGAALAVEPRYVDALVAAWEGAGA